MKDYLKKVHLIVRIIDTASPIALIFGRMRPAMKRTADCRERD